MTTSQYMLRLIAWRRAEFFWNVVMWGLFHLIPVAYGLSIKAIFDSLSQGTAAGANAWTFLAILAGCYASRQVIFLLNSGNLLTMSFLASPDGDKRCIFGAFGTWPTSNATPHRHRRR